MTGYAVVRHYTGNKYPTLKFDQNEWEIVGDREDAEELAASINKLVAAQRIPLESSDDL